jgi:hypothetical protein
MAIPPNRPIILSFPPALETSSGIPPIYFSSAMGGAFNGTDFIVRSKLNYKRVRGRGVGGGIHVAQPGIYNPKVIWNLPEAYLIEPWATRFETMFLLQQTAPYRGEVVLTDYNRPANQLEAAYPGRTALDTVTANGVTRQFFSVKVFLQLSDGGKSDDGSTSQSDILRWIDTETAITSFDAIENS